MVGLQSIVVTTPVHTSPKVTISKTNAATSTMLVPQGAKPSLQIKNVPVKAQKAKTLIKSGIETHLFTKT